MDLKNIFKFKKKRNVSLREGYYAPAFHWQLSLGVALLIILLGAGLGVVLYVLVSRPIVIDSNVGVSSTSKSDEKAVEDTLLYFRTKAETFSSLKEGTTKYVDPSVPLPR